MGTRIARVLAELADARGSKKKQELLASLRQDEVATQVIYHTLNPFWTYGVQPDTLMIPKDPKGTDRVLDEKWPAMRIVLNSLMDRKITGNEARKMICGWGLAQWVMDRIVAKDLRCGVEAKTVNSAFGSVFIPVFEVALADEGLVIIDGKITQTCDFKYPIWAEPKYDGIRCIAVVGEVGAVTLLSRNGKEFENYPNLVIALQQQPNLRGWVLDGEVHGATFDDAASIVHRKGGKDDKDLVYRVWDCMTICDFEKGLCEQPLWLRQRTIQTMLRPSEKIMQTPGRLVKDEADLLQLFKQTRDAGYEGLILKPLDAKYSFKRSRDWIKVKEMATGEYKVVSFFEGKGKYAGSLGGLIVDVDGVQVEVGSGYDDQQRATIWLSREDYLGKVAEVKYQEKTPKKADGTGGSLRFPVFLRWRPDKE